MEASEAELARSRLLALVPAGLEEVEVDDAVELAVYVDSATEATIEAVLGAVESAPVETGWEDRWRAFHRPARAGGLWIGPPWESPPEGEPAITIEPGRAFGTGAHPTTRAAIALLAALPRGSLVDAGCGSGVLAIAASKLGFAPVLALDVDPVAVEVARENVRTNASAVEVEALDVVVGTVPPADVVVANIDLRAVDSLLAGLSSPRAVVSGYLTRDRLRARGWLRAARLQVAGWAADSLIRRHGRESRFESRP